MLTFLRKIRKSFIENGSARKYILYAVGEILLVMIGILLALQVNKWNQARSNNERELMLIQTLQDELVANAKYLDNRINYLTNVVENKGKQLLSLTGPNAQDIPKDSLAPLLLNAIYQFPYAPITAQYQQVINSEDFHLINNDSLQSTLRRYQSTLNLTAYQQYEMREHIIAYLQSNYSTLQMMEYQKGRLFDNLKNANYENNHFPINSVQILRDPIFQGMLVTRLEANRYSISLLNALSRHVKEIIGMINRNYPLNPTD